ncbi:hypothetical protein [Pseudomonas putida]|uniref:hypothetical protein n=1 Tax=Pseudomonas putida TaxID=303 RepID=UPI00081970CE|nr:hypothetical protein [Pseudomonas putida]OCT22286.1 hypothetical protein A6E24_15245 [Pseudomonas putida]OCT23786.1 hypothetical protein A6E23_17555 [Pseudomonas putida]OCT24501.1 hypothetical protein A6E20_11325 [Pseudomonas putida]OCT37779.1 hypothetical protein A6E19_16785 [Pseudomonas putida]
MYQQLPSFVLGFHGCDRQVGEAILAGDNVSPSVNDYDWLGAGAYFWENSPERALSYAQRIKQHKRGQGSIKDPYVVGAVINPGLCLNLTEQGALQELGAAYQLLASSSDALPENKPGFTGDTDNLKRFLDCLVFQSLHSAREVVGLEPYHWVRSPFLEGTCLYPGTGFRQETHIQLCVREITCIKGYFRPLNPDGTLFQP